VPAGKLAGADAPLTEAIRSGAGLGDWAGDLMSFGALVAITSVVVTIFFGPHDETRRGRPPRERAHKRLGRVRLPVVRERELDRVSSSASPLQQATARQT
ncbi:MAG TPA: hypothetical protein VGM33_23700, partial [Baekduia sp.]|jgi:APA family basic amino acid/polyamine antiporter